MATYNPPAFPRRPFPKKSNPITEIRYQLQLAYYRYEINTALYVMSPGEKLAYNLIVLSLLAFLVTSAWWYFPDTVKYSVGRLGYYITGSYRVTDGGMRHVSGAVMDRTVEAAQSLVQGAGGLANASAVFLP